MKTSLLVLAAGLGSRYGGVKQVEPVGPSGESTLEYSLYDAFAAGFDEAVFLVRASIEEDFRAGILARLPDSMRRRLAFQELESLLEPEDLAAARASGRSKPWGTAHALLCAAGELDAPFAVANADDFYGRESFRRVHDFLAARGPESRDWCMAGFELRNTTSPHGSVSRGICVIRPREAAAPAAPARNRGDGSAGEAASGGGRGRASEAPAAGCLGELVSVTEHPAIVEVGAAEAGGRRYLSRHADGSSVALDGGVIVSMNLWGLTPAVFPLARPLFREFMEASRDSPTAEFYLPALLDALVAQGEARVEVLPTPEAWFGLTYREDAPAARARIAALVAKGVYPSSLWDAPRARRR